MLYGLSPDNKGKHEAGRKKRKPKKGKDEHDAVCRVLNRKAGLLTTEVTRMRRLVFNIFMIQPVHIGFLPVRDPATEQLPVFLIYTGCASHA